MDFVKTVTSALQKAIAFYAAGSVARRARALIFVVGALLRELFRLRPRLSRFRRLIEGDLADTLRDAEATLSPTSTRGRRDERWLTLSIDTAVGFLHPLGNPVTRANAIGVTIPIFLKELSLLRPGLRRDREMRNILDKMRTLDWVSPSASMRRETMTPQEIMKKVWALVDEYASGDPDGRFYIVRYLFQRLKRDEDEKKRAIKKELMRDHPRCEYCREELKPGDDIVVHRMDSTKGYRKGNYVLMHRRCHQKWHKEHKPDAPSGSRRRGKEQRKSVAYRRDSLRGRVIERHEAASKRGEFDEWDFDETVRQCITEDGRLEKEGPNPAGKFREARHNGDNTYIRRWVRGGRWPWL